jgi:phosphoglucomutase
VTTDRAGISSLAGQPAQAGMLVDVPALVAAYYTERPDPAEPGQRVAFGTSGHRGSSLSRSFNEVHIVAISQAICRHRKLQRVDGPLFLGYDTHALSEPAFRTALEVLAANGVDVKIDAERDYTPTPAVSHAILVHNRGRTTGLADGIVITPSHNPPDEGGFKYNPPHGGPADTAVTRAIETEANRLLAAGPRRVRRLPYEAALHAPTTHRHDYAGEYVADLGAVVDLDAIRVASVRVGVDPLGGAGVHYWARIAERYRLDLTLVSEEVDPTFRFMTADWDGKIRMDPSSSYAMGRLIGLRDRFDVAFACDTDHDRHGIVARSAGLLPPNHYLAAAIAYLFAHRPVWRADAGVGKTAVSSSVIDRVAAMLGRRLDEVPVGFKWFVGGLVDGTLGFAGEESAGASFLRRDGTVWTTDKDGIIAGLLAAEMTAATGRDPGELYDDLTRKVGASAYARHDIAVTPEDRTALAALTPDQARIAELGGEPVRAVLTTAPSNGAALGGLKVVAENAWFAARPSGTEPILRLYAESFRGEDHLRRVFADARAALTQLAGAARSR